MANDLRNDTVWVVDTASSLVKVTADTCSIAAIRWVGTLAGAGGAEIANSEGEVVWAARGAAGELSAESVETDLQLHAGFFVPTLAAGTLLYVYLCTRNW